MKYKLQIILGCVLCWFLAGCISTKYIERKQYLLEVPKNVVKSTTTQIIYPIFIDNVSAVAPFDQLDFLYRIESGRYLVDYYNGFLVAPSTQLDGILAAYLRFYGYSNLNTTESTFSNRLRVKLIELYADYRNHNDPRAVIAIQFHLTTFVAGKSVVLSDKIFRASIALKVKNTESLLSAWNEGLRDVFKQWLQTLHAITAP